MEEPKPDFTAGDLLAQISSQLSITDEGMTTRELCEGMGLPTTDTNMARVHRQVKNLIALGKAEYAGRKRSATVMGTDWASPAWKLVTGKQAEGEVATALRNSQKDTVA